MALRWRVSYDDTMRSRSAWLSILFVFVVGAGTRVGWVVARHGANPEVLTFPDEHAYQLAGRSLAAGQGLIDEFGYRATYMPGYPAFIALFERFDWSMLSLRLTQAVLAALVAPFTFLLAQRWVLLVWRAADTKSAACVAGSEHPVPVANHVFVIPLLASLAAAVDPFLVFFSGLLLTEALFTVVLVATWWMVLGLMDYPRGITLGRCVGLGVLLIGCIMLRPAATLLVAVVPAGVLLYQRFNARAWLGSTVIIAVVVLGLSPWAMRNFGVLGQARWTTTRGGITLYDSVQPHSVGGSDLAHTKLEPAAIGLNELEWDRYWHEQAMTQIRNDPGRMLKLAGRKFLRTWNIVPNEPGHRQGTAAWISAAWMLTVLGAAVIGLWGVRRAVVWWTALLLPVAVFTALHMIYIGSVRYRIPVMPMMFVLAAAGLWWVFRLHCSRKEAGGGGQSSSETNAHNTTVEDSSP